MSKPVDAMSIEILTHSVASLDDSVLLGRNHPEIIRDRI